jgi:hypothetical protein
MEKSSEKLDQHSQTHKIKSSSSGKAATGRKINNFDIRVQTF